MDNPPRSKRHAQEDDDELRPDAAIHTFDAPGLTNPLTTENQTGETGVPSASNVDSNSEEYVSRTMGQSVPEAEVVAANHTREPDNDQSAWLDEDFEDEDDNLPVDADREV